MKKISKISIKLMAIIIGALTVSGIALASSVWPCSSTLTDLDEGLISDPSGATVYGGYLWVIGNNGYLWRMNLDGSGKISTNLGGDLEAITQKDGYLYVVKEYPATVYQVTPNTGSTATYAGTLTGTSWDLSGTIVIPSTDSNAGVESMTTDGTNFYLNAQLDTIDEYVYIFDNAFNPIATVTLPYPSYTDLSDLYYQDGTFYALFDGDQRIMLMTIDSTTAPTAFTILKDAGGVNDARYQTLESDWEGIAFNGTDLYITRDPSSTSGLSPALYKFTGFPTITSTTSAPAPTAPDYTTLSTVVKNRTPKTLTVTYSAGDVQTITYSAPYARVRTAVTSDYHTLLVLDGVTLSVYQDGAVVYTFSLLAPL